MPDLTITAANVEEYPGASIITAEWGEAVTQGQPVYLHTDSLWYLSDANVAADDDVDGISLSAGGAGQKGIVQTGGDIDVGATLAIGTVYVVSAAVGMICPIADITSGQTILLLGIAVAADKLRMFIDNNTQIAKA